MDDKDIEANRYDDRAQIFLEAAIDSEVSEIESFLKPPINSYQKLLAKIPSGSNVLEIGAGMGENTDFY